MAARLDRLGMFRLIADKIARDPSLLAIGLENLSRWSAQGADQPHRLAAWRVRIEAARVSPEALADLLALLREEGEAADLEREFSPFAGVLTTEERRPFLLSCSYAH